MDFYFWDRIKQIIVYLNRLPNDVEVLKNRIRDTLNYIPPEEIRPAFTAFRKNIEERANKGGGLIDILIIMMMSVLR